MYNRKHLAFSICCKYVDADTGEVNINYLKDVQTETGPAVTVFNEIKNKQ